MHLLESKFFSDRKKIFKVISLQVNSTEKVNVINLLADCLANGYRKLRSR